MGLLIGTRSSSCRSTTTTATSLPTLCSSSQMIEPAFEFVSPLAALRSTPYSGGPTPGRSTPGVSATPGPERHTVKTVSRPGPQKILPKIQKNAENHAQIVACILPSGGNHQRHPFVPISSPASCCLAATTRDNMHIVPCISRLAATTREHHSYPRHRPKCLAVWRQPPRTPFLPTSSSRASCCLAATTTEHHSYPRHLLVLLVLLVLLLLVLLVLTR